MSYHTKEQLENMLEDVSKLGSNINAKTPRMSQRCKGVWESIPICTRMVDGVARRVDRFSAIGDGQVPAVAALAWEILSEGL